MGALRITEEELRELLVTRLEALDAAGFERARKMAARLRVPLERAVVERGRVPLNFILGHVAELWGVGFVDLRVSDVKPEALALLSEEYARQHVLLPFELEDDRLHVAMWNPRDRQAIDEIERTTRRKAVRRPRARGPPSYDGTPPAENTTHPGPTGLRLWARGPPGSRSDSGVRCGTTL